MSRPPNDRNAAAFREAVSQWQLAARTEVKRSSSLPSSMFDAHDPMLEAGLAQSVEAMMQCLHEPDDQLPAREQDEQFERRIETVDPEELRQLPARVAGAPTQLAIDEGLSAEFLNILVDTCLSGDDATRHAARRLLVQHFDVPDEDADSACRALADGLQQVLLAQLDDRDHRDEQLAQLSRRIAAAAFADVLGVDGQDTSTPPDSGRGDA